MPVLSSKLETKFEEEFLQPLKVQYVKQYRIGIFVYDFYLPEYKCLIEIQGTFWHGDPRVYKSEDLSAMQRKNRKRDENKKVSAKSLGFHYLAFWEGDVIFNAQMVKETLEAELP